MENKTSCSAGKTILIDPNKFDGQSSSSNISVPLEDLSIFVQLETTKKARTILNNNGISSNFKSTEGAYVTFIEGDNVATKKALTTSYTDLTTNLTESNIQQSLGITSIDIDFNSSNAPLIVINFIDLRGSAIFQNEEFLANGENKYAEFFNLPYPIFTLTVKGYYGMPVKYNLHLTKFNARFNSQTVNFEITANFVGYTYAMLSDMLLGYLRAIPYTKKGAAKYEDIKKTRVDILTLDELAQKISKIDEEVKKLEESNPDVANLNRLTSKLELITSLKSSINTFGQTISLNPDANDFRYVFKDTTVYDEDAIKQYNQNVIDYVKLFNTEMFQNISLNETDLTIASVKQYFGLSREMLSSTGSSAVSVVKVLLSKSSDVEKTKKDLINYGRENNIAWQKGFDAYDFTEILNLLNTTEIDLKKQGNNLKIKVSNTLKDSIEKELKFVPSIRKIVGSFTAAVEVLMHVLYDVSTEALTSEIRKTELKKKFKNNNSFDYKPLSVNNVSSNTASGVLNQNFYPWPEYREGSDEKGYVEKYLGDPGVLDATKVDETIFIDDLLKAFLTSAEKIAEIDLASELNNTNWIPVNPLDTRLFIESFPYKRIQGNTKEEVIALLIERAMIYMGYSNMKLTKEEIIEIANKESDAILSLIGNDTVKQSLSQLTDDDYYNVKAKNDGVNTSLIKKLNNEWYYNFIYEIETINSGENANFKKVLPITTNNNSNFEYNFKILDDTKKDSDDGKLFLTNYTSSSYLNADNTLNIKDDDGGIYVKILTPDVYRASIKSTSTVNESSTLLFDVLKQPQEVFNQKFTEVGFDQYSGPYSIQDYKVMDFGVDKLTKAEYRLMFYANNNESDNELLSIGSLCYKRGESDGTIYDITGEKIKQIEDTDDIIRNTVGNDATHTSIGENRILLNSLIEEKSTKITYPFIGFQVKNSTESYSIGLFGSRLYNQQVENSYNYSVDYAKSLLFLHTLPWNGLYEGKNGSAKGIFNVNEILNTFGNRAGFISAPKLWVAFIGGMLWRADTNKPEIQKGTKRIIGGGSGTSDPIRWVNGSQSLIPSWDINTSVPGKKQYLTVEKNIFFQTGSMVLGKGSTNLYHKFIDLDEVLLQLPEQVKNEFKQVFFNFVETDWVNLKSYLEVFTGTPNDWINSCDSLLTSVNVGGGLYPDGTLSKNKLFSEFNSGLDNYMIFTTYKDEPELKYNFMTELRDESNGVKTILQLLVDEVYIANTTYKIWQENKSKSPYFSKRIGVFVSDEDLSTFISTCKTKFAAQTSQTVNEKKKQEKNQIFGSDNDSVIKFQLYRTCKNIYDKWIGGTDSLTNLMFGKPELRNDLDKALANGNELRLIDSFRFVSRSFKDIGDDFIVNPTVIIDFIKNNQNSSFYDVVTSLLSANNFDFIALPSFINFRDETLGNLFQPMSTYDAFNVGEVGPSFVCVYVGQTSKNLDFKSSEYPNDGVDFRCDADGNLMTSLAKDFYEKNEPYENKVAVFSVNYSQQNQNIFKDIILDQNEFTETAESLKIIDDIATNGSENRRTYGGQNLFNVYSVRSYKAEVEMMGNAMIQPMMYFQLNNIPMFHGAYMITHVKHNIKPNHMSTSFTGVRIRNVETPLIGESEFYMSLLDSIGIDAIDNSVKEKSTDLVVYTGTSAATRPPKKSIKCDTVTRDVKTFEDVLELVVDNLEGSYCPGGLSCGSDNSGETLWGLDRLNHSGALDSKLWALVDKEDKSKWNASKYPKPKDEPEIYEIYYKIIKSDYDSFSKKLSSELKAIIESDGRLYFNMIYAVYNGSGYFQQFGKVLQSAYDDGKRTSDELLAVFIDARLSGGKVFYPNTKPKSAEIIANTGVDIQKMVGLGAYCTKPVV